MLYAYAYVQILTCLFLEALNILKQTRIGFVTTWHRGPEGPSRSASLKNIYKSQFIGVIDELPTGGNRWYHSQEIERLGPVSIYLIRTQPSYVATITSPRHPSLRCPTLHL